MPQVWMETPRLTDGVSQQPDSRRFRSQAELAYNTLMTVIDGLDKRNGTTHVAALGSGDVHPNQWHHWAEGSNNERYVFIGYNAASSFGSSRLTAFDLNGTQLHVEDRVGAQAFDYVASGITTSNARESLRFQTIFETTLIVNKNVTPLMDPTPASTAPPFGEALVWIRGGNYQVTYEVEVETATAGVQTVSTTTWDGNSAGAGEISEIDTALIAEDLRTKLVALGTLTVVREGSVLHIQGTSGDELVKVLARDGVGDGTTEALFGDVDNFAARPKYAPDGFQYVQAGDPNLGSDDTPTVFRAEVPGDFGPGVWEQALVPGTPDTIDPATMPHQLVRRQGTGAALPSGYTPAVGEIYFDYEQPEWGKRLVGSTELTPDPSFIGSKIQNVFLHKNRLGFLTGDRIVLSEINGFFNFWRTDLANVLDSDRLDFSVSDKEVTTLEQVAAVRGDLLVMSKDIQFAIRGADALTAKTVSADPVLRVRCDTEVPPIPLRSGILFAQDNAVFSNVHEAYRQGDSELYDSAELTEQVQRFIPGKIRTIAASTESDTVAIMTHRPGADAKNRLFIYQYYWNGNRRLQSAWCEWVLTEETEIRGIHFFNDLLYLLVSRGGQLYLEVIDTAVGGTDFNQDFRVKLDRKTLVSTGTTYDVGTNTTTIPLPYDLAPEDVPEALTWSQQSAVPKNSQLYVTEIDRTTPGSHTIKVVGDYSGLGAVLWVGVRYQMRYDFPSLLAKQPTETGERAILSTPKTVFRGRIAHEDSGPYRVEVEQRGAAAPAVYKHTGRRAGDPVLGAFAGEQPLDSGELVFPILGQARDVKVRIYNDSPFPARLQRAEWYVLLDTVHGGT